MDSQPFAHIPSDSTGSIDKASNIKEDFNIVTMVVLKIKCGDRIPRKINIETDLRSLQREVKGHIEAFYPFQDEVAIVCNDEGAINGMPVCRIVNGMPIHGDFLICGLTEEDFGSLNDEALNKYRIIFRNFIIQH